MKEFLHKACRSIRCGELTDDLTVIREFMHERNYVPCFTEPDMTAALAFALGVRYGKSIERVRLHRHNGENDVA